MKKETLTIHFDADQVRLSHIVLLKELFRSAPGDHPVQLEFFSQNDRVGKLSIDATWGVSPTSSLQGSLKKLPSILQTTLA